MYKMNDPVLSVVCCRFSVASCRRLDVAEVPSASEVTTLWHYRRLIIIIIII